MRSRALVVVTAGLVALVAGGTAAVVVLQEPGSPSASSSSSSWSSSSDVTREPLRGGAVGDAARPDDTTGDSHPSGPSSSSASAPAAPPSAREPLRPATRPRVTPVPPTVTNRRFRLGAAGALSEAVTAGEWTVIHGRAVATAGERVIDAALTVPTYYAEIERLTIRGGLELSSPHNFRVQAGPVSLIFNWELAEENHYRMGTRRTESGPPALVPGREHEIVLEQHDELVHLSVDGELLWKARGRLHGPITVYPALGSTIEVREISVRGRAVPDVAVTGPAYPLQ